MRPSMRSGHDARSCGLAEEPCAILAERIEHVEDLFADERIAVALGRGHEGRRRGKAVPEHLHRHRVYVGAERHYVPREGLDVAASAVNHDERLRMAPAGLDDAGAVLRSLEETDLRSEQIDPDAPSHASRPSR
jgi:hypothetical protein